MAKADGTYWQRFYVLTRRGVPKQAFQWILDGGAAGTCTLTLHSTFSDEGATPGPPDPPDITEALTGEVQFQAAAGADLTVQVIDNANKLAGYECFYAKFVLATGGVGDADFSGGRKTDWTD